MTAAAWYLLGVASAVAAQWILRRLARRGLSAEDGSIGGDARARWIATMEHGDLLRLRNAVGAEIHRRSVQ